MTDFHRTSLLLEESALNFLWSLESLLCQELSLEETIIPKIISFMLGTLVKIYKPYFEKIMEERLLTIGYFFLLILCNKNRLKWPL